MTLRARFPNTLGPPPSDFTGDTFKWLQRLSDRISALPPTSIFSGDPNSAVTGAVATLGLNISPSSATSAFWVKQAGSSNTGWAPVG